tara:strand:- start:52 stop:246 length:195 start_codon:yes stop_codon:yes gene_type:complete
MDIEDLILYLDVAFNGLYDLTQDTGPLTPEQVDECLKGIKERHVHKMREYREATRYQNIVLLPA